MASIRQRLIDKIKTDCSGELIGLEEKITADLPIHRPTLSWQQKTAGRMVWYWYIDGYCIGSSENMKDLLKATKLEVYKPCFGDFEISSS